MLAFALSLTPGIGAKTVVRVLARNDLLGRSTKEFMALSSESLVEEYKLTFPAAQAWAAERRNHFQRAVEITGKLDSLGIGFLTAADSNYPQALETFSSDCPGVLYTYGNLNLLRAKTFTVFSSRNSPPAALDSLETLTEQGVLAGEILVTGHNTPEYQRAAIVPLRWGAPRILVLDREFFDALGTDLKEEPFRAARLWRYQFDATTDLALTTLPPDARTHRGANRTRDKIIAGLAHRHDFVTINPGGNMEKLARQVVKSGRTIRVDDSFIGSKEWERYGVSIVK